MGVQIFLYMGIIFSISGFVNLFFAFSGFYRRNYMDNKELGLKLKQLRTSHKLLQSDIATIVGKSSSAVSRYEKGEAEIPATVIIDLCNNFNISIDNFLGISNPISGFDNSLLSLLNNATNHDVDRIKTYLEVANCICNENSSFYTFNPTVDVNLVYEDSIQYGKPILTIPVRGYVAAGKPIEAIDNVIKHIDLMENLDVDYALIVNGNSMDPLIKDGEYVFVKSTKELNNNDIGVFYYNGNVTCKKFFKNDVMVKLISLNPTYEDFVFYLNDSKNEYINFKIEGKVLLSDSQSKRLTNYLTFNR